MNFILQANSGLSPSLVPFLKSIPIDSLNFGHYKLRHPGAIYNLMTSKLIDSIHLLSCELRTKNIDNLKSYFRLVLHDFFQLYESCYEIMVCFCKLHTLPLEKEFLNKWLRKNNYKMEADFHEKIKNEINDLRNLFNKLKHTSNDLQLITFKNETERTTGYYLEMPHEAYKDPLNPTSLSRELKRIYFLIYFISENLKQVLMDHLKVAKENQFQNYSKEIKDDSFIQLRNDINTLSRFYLLNEIGKEVYENQLNSDSISFSQEMISGDLFDDYYVKGINMQMFFTVDGYNNTVTVPQCGLRQIGSKFYYQSHQKGLREVKIIKT